jgi:hypothetical protein
MVDHGIDLKEPLGGIFAKDVGLYVDQNESVHFVEFIGCDHAYLDSQRLDQGPILGASDFAERNQWSGGSLAAQNRSERVAARDSVGVGVGLQKDSNAFPAIEKRTQLDNALEIREMVELVVNVVSDQGLEPGSPYASVMGQVFVGEQVGEHQDRNVGINLGDLADRGADPRPIVAGQGVLVRVEGIEFLKGLLGESALEGPKARGPGA